MDYVDQLDVLRKFDIFLKSNKEISLNFAELQLLLDGVIKPSATLKLIEIVVRSFFNGADAAYVLNWETDSGDIEAAGAKAEVILLHHLAKRLVLDFTISQPSLVQ